MLIVIQTVLVLFLLALSAFFSGSETALFSLSPLTRRKLAREKRFGVVMEPYTLLPTILFGNILVNVSLSYFITRTTIRYLGSLPNVTLIILTVSITFIILIFGEITPKFASAHKAESVIRRGLSILLFFQKLFTPFSFPVSLAMSRLWRRNVERLGASDIKVMIDIAREKGYVTDRERRFVQRVFSLKEIKAEDVMTPRKKIEALDEKTPLASIIKGGYLHSRIPLYRKEIDNITGILYIKDLLPYLRNGFPKTLRISALKRETFFIPSTMRLSDLLEDFQERRVHIAICVDEYGGVDGLITLDDIIERTVEA